MRFSVLILLLLFSATAKAQSVNFEDDFSDRNLSDWSGTTDHFIFQEEQDNVLLQQKADGAGISYLSTPSNNSTGYWDLFIRMDFAPSESNKTEIYLMSDTPDLTGSVNGYMLKAGENGSNDVFRLYRITGGAEDGEILSGTTDLSSGGDFRVRITRDAGGAWTLEVAKGYDGLLTEEASGSDNTYTATSHFGFKTTYTSTRADLFSFDFKIDIPPLSVNQLEVVSENEIALTFSREVDPNTVENQNFILQPGSEVPGPVTRPAPDSLLLQFGSSLPGGEYVLQIKDLRDQPHQTTLMDTLIHFIIYDEFENGDIIINEFMKDPPDGAAEYIELWNTSSRYLNLKNWRTGDNNALSVISTTDLAFPPESYMVLSADTSLLYNYFGEAHYHQLSLPALNNTTDQVRLYDAAEKPVDSLQYEPDWGGQKIALERRSKTVSGIYQGNWGDSPAPDFGTPGLPNAIPPDTEPPEITDILIHNDQTLLLITSERLQNSTAENIQNYQLSTLPASGITSPTAPAIVSAEQIAADTLRLSLDTPLAEYDGKWAITAQTLTDIFGNERSQTVEFAYYRIFSAQQGQVAINEFMYDPAPDFSEFIELYNHSDSSFDMQNWTLNDNTGNQRIISSSSSVLPKDDYVVLAPDSSLIKIFPGLPLLVMHSRFPALNNGSDAIVIRNEDGQLIDSLSYSSAWGGDERSLERRLPNFPSIHKENWGDSPAAELATPGLPNLIQPDQTPPGIHQINRRNSDVLEIIFSERIRRQQAENISNYTVSINPDHSTIPSITAAHFIEPDTVLLSFDAPLPIHPNGSTYHISISNMNDLFGNKTGMLSDSLFLIEYEPPDPNNISINEFMYDPPDDHSEFIELYNHGDHAVNLRNWTFNDNTRNRRVITNSDFPLLPGAFVVLTPDSSLHDLFPGIPLIAMGNRFSSLNNGADAIVIRDQNTDLLDSLSYKSDWGGDEVSLERRSVDFPAYLPENWGDSPADQGTTPGEPNQLQPDETPPEFTAIGITAADTLTLHFSERIDSLLAVQTMYYEITSSISIKRVQYQHDKVVLVLNKPLQDGTSYTITVEKQQDLFGNIMPTTSLDLDYTNFSPAQPADIVINEILYRRTDADSEEFVEFFNRSGRNINLGSWELADAAGSTTFPEHLPLRSGEYLVVTDSELFAQQTGALHLSGFPSLNDDDDAIVLKDQTGMVIDSIYYHSRWGGDEHGISLERLHPKNPTNDGSNWASSKSETGHTAGSQSSVFQVDESPPELIFANLLADQTVQVVFSEFVDISSARLQVNGEAVEISHYREDQANRILLEIEGDLSDEPLLLKAEGLTDILGNESEKVSIDIARPLTPGSLIINEIMYDPRANAQDKLPDQPEYLEVYNVGKSALSLEGLYMHNHPDENGNVRALHPDDTRYRWIPAGGYAVLHAEPARKPFQESLLATYFDRSEKDEKEASYLPVIRSSLSLGNNNDAIYIADSTGVIIDSVHYADAWQNPNLHETQGVALEKIDPSGPSNDEANWSSSTHVSGGTPGQQNSIFQTADMLSPDTVIDFSPDPFSPDGDGFEDHLFIRYRLKEPDYLLRIQIFDRYGRKVRTLTEGKAAGLEGSLIWDGLKDNGTRNRIGFYIILFEAYNSHKGKKITRKKTVVLARKF